MAKKKSGIRSREGRKGSGEPWWTWPLRFLRWRPVRYLILVLIVAAVVRWQWWNIVSWAVGIAESLFRLFGWGLVLIALAILSVVWVLWRRKFRFAFRHLNKYLGSLSLALAAWGVLSFFPGQGVLRWYNLGLGGSFGLGIIGQPDFIGGLRILALVIIGVVLIIPRHSFWFVVNSISGLIKQLKKRPAPRPVRQPRATLPPVAVTPESFRPTRPVEIEPERKAVKPKITPAPVATPTKEELKQVAQDVWRKYGESPDLVVVDGWKLPPVDILDVTPEVQFSQADNMKRAALIEEALGSYGVEAKVVQINSGPAVTQFGVEPGWDRKMKEVREKDRDGNVKTRLEEVSKTRVKVERISSLANDLTLALAAPSIRIEAPVPGKSVVGIEVPNTILSLVSLRGVIETSVFQKMESKSRLTMALGKGAGGEAISADLSKMPHLLVAGATGSGKTVCLNSIICCLMMYCTPNDVRFIMIDPKRVELTTYNTVPHLATPVIVDADKAVDALRWLSQEMNKRYQQLAAAGSRNIELYNKNRSGEERMPFLVLFIDELADLMMTGNADEVEQTLCRLAQLSRAVGIHLVVATQRPSVDVVTGLIKANFPTRISFAVTSQVDSRTILDGGGAEKLLGRGDMLYLPTEAGKPKRLQGCFVSEAEMERLVFFWGSQKREDKPSLKLADLAQVRKESIPVDPLLESARQLAEQYKHVSTSFLQRRLRIGYPRAARIMEQLQEEGFGEEKGEGEGEGEV